MNTPSSSSKRRRRFTSRPSPSDTRESKKHKNFSESSCSESDSESDIKVLINRASDSAKMSQPLQPNVSISATPQIVSPGLYQGHTQIGATAAPQPTGFNQEMAASQTIAISDADILRIASCIKNLITADINLMIEQSTAPLRQEIMQLRSENENIKLKLDDLEQYSRRPLVRFSGISEQGSDENTTSLVLDVAARGGLEVTSDDIERSHRVGPPNGSKPRQIIVRLKNHDTKIKLLKSKRNLLKDRSCRGISINEDLTKMRNKLAYEARQIVRRKAAKQTWTRDGKIFIRDLNDRVLSFTSEKALFEKFQQAATTTSANGHITASYAHTAATAMLTPAGQP